jgi:hypothetical protein
MEEDMEKALEPLSHNKRPPLEAAEAIIRYIDHFDQLMQELDARMRGVSKELDAGGDSLPGRHFGWKTQTPDRSSQKGK